MISMQGGSSIDLPAAGAAPAVGAAYRRRTVAMNFLAISVASGLVVLIGIFTAAYSRRALGPVAVGQVNWNAAVLAYLALFANPGLQTIGQRDIAADPRRTASMTGLVLGLQLLFAVVAYAAVLAIALLNPRGGQGGALLLLQGLSILINAGSVAWVLQAHERMVGPAIASLILNLLQIPALVALVHNPDDVFLFVLYTLPFSLAVIVYNFWYLQHRGLLRFGDIRLRLASGAGLLGEAWPLALSQGAVLLIYNCGTIVLGFTGSDEEVGLYTTAYKLMFISTVVSGAMMSAYFPVLSKVAGDPPQARRVASEFTSLMVWMGLPIAALGWACGRHVNDLLFGSQFAGSGPYFEWLCLSIGLVFVNIGLGTPLMAWGHQKLHFKIIALASLASLALNLALVPRYGGWGAVAAILVAESLALVMLAAARRRLGFGRHKLMPILGPPLVCCTAVALALAGLPEGASRYWLLEIGVGTAVLGGCLFVFERRIVVAALGLVRRAA